MKTLLTSIQGALKADLSGVRDGDIFISPFSIYLPQAIGSPAIGIKDHGVRRSELAGGMLEVERSVVVTAWVSVIDLKKAITGSASQTGILDLAGNVDKILDENLLELNGCIEAFCRAQSPSEMVFTESAPWQRMELTYKYLFEEARP